MTEGPDVIAALLHVAEQTSPFNGSHALYSAVKFKRGYPLNSVETPTVALYAFGGTGVPRGLGMVKQYRSPTVRGDILAETWMDGARIYEKCRDAWQRDYDCDAAGVVGTVGTGYMRETGEIKGIDFGEPRRAAWDSSASNVVRLLFDLTLLFRD